MKTIIKYVTVDGEEIYIPKYKLKEYETEILTTNYERIGKEYWKIIWKKARPTRQLSIKWE